MISDAEKLQLIKIKLQEWATKQGHDKCWYYPEIFKEIADICGVNITIQNPQDIPIEEFRSGCITFTTEMYNENY